MQTCVAGVGTGGTVSTFDPLTIPWAVAWPASSATGASDGNPITGITDASGNGKNGAVLDAGHAPIYRASAINGKPALENTTSATLRRVNATWTAWSSPFAIVVVAKSLTPAQTFKAFAGNGGASANQLLGTEGTPKWRQYAGTGFVTTATADGNAHLFIAEFNGASSIFTIDGAATTGNPGANTTLDGLTICTGGNGAAAGAYQVGWAAAINRVLTGTEKTDLRGWSQTYFATA